MSPPPPPNGDGRVTVEMGRLIPGVEILGPLTMDAHEERSELDDGCGDGGGDGGGSEIRDGSRAV